MLSLQAADPGHSSTDIPRAGECNADVSGRAVEMIRCMLSPAGSHSLPLARHGVPVSGGAWRGLAWAAAGGVTGAGGGDERR